MDQLMELRPHQFAQVPNEAVDTLPDMNSIGLLTTMLRHAPGYRFTVADVIKKKSKIPGPKLGKTAAYGAMDTLLEHRWACRVRFMCAKGHWNTGLFRTYTRFTDDDFREACRRFKPGTPIRIRCKGCTKNPEDEVQTTIRPGAKLIWSESIKAGPEYKYGHPIKELMAPGGLLSTTPSSGIPELGVTCEEDASSQVGPSSGKPTVGQPTVGEAEVFYKTGGEDSSSSSDPDVPPSPEGLVDEEESPSAKKQRRTGAGVTLVQEMTDATVEEAQAVITRLRAESKRLTGRDIGSVRHYIDAFEPEDLTPHLDAVRAQRASQGRTRSSQSPRRATCSLHHIQIPCTGCRSELLSGDQDAAVVIEMYRDLGPEAASLRPDLAEQPAILNALATA